jgi:hypothetical protein
MESISFLLHFPVEAAAAGTGEEFYPEKYSFSA